MCLLHYGEITTEFINKMTFNEPAIEKENESNWLIIEIRKLLSASHILLANVRFDG